MTLTECLRRMVETMRAEEIPFAVAGGLAASLYRKRPRFTGDVDLIVALGSADQSHAEKIVRELGFRPVAIRQAEFDGGPLFAIKRKSTPVVMVAGRHSASVEGIGADLLLTALPWVETALKRAKHHEVDFGFGKVPVLTLEDVILSKLYALGKAVNRPKDLDDLLSIYKTGPLPDLVYLQARIDALKIGIPTQRKRTLPEELRPLV